jgi:alkylhydroperoxidase/carboxymuconolactone decarboxylase family protein YurZ
MPQINNRQALPLAGAGAAADITIGKGALSDKHRALIAAACAMSLGCDPYAAELSQQATELGITREELIEVASLAQAVGARSITFQSAQTSPSVRLAKTQAELEFSEWYWVQDDGCVLGTTD